MKTHNELFLGCLLLTVFIFVRKGVVSIEVNQSVVPVLPVLGNEDFTLQCFFTLSLKPPEELQTIILQRKRDFDDQFYTIVTFPPGTSVFEPTFQDTTLEQRCVANKPGNILTSSATLTCNTTECGDRAEYKWSVNYFTGQMHTQEIEKDLKIKVFGTFSGSTEYGLRYSPNMDITEGTNITFTCMADVGVEPQGKLEWYYYLPHTETPISVSHLASYGLVFPARMCSLAQKSTLTLTMTKEYNGIIVRCTLQQDATTPDGNEHRQTNAITVTALSESTTDHTRYSTLETTTDVTEDTTFDNLTPAWSITSETRYTDITISTLQTTMLTGGDTTPSSTDVFSSQDTRSSIIILSTPQAPPSTPISNISTSLTKYVTTSLLLPSTTTYSAQYNSGSDGMRLPTFYIVFIGTFLQRVSITASLQYNKFIWLL